MAEKEGFEPSIPFWGIHDFQSCALGQLRDFSKTILRCNQLVYNIAFTSFCQPLISFFFQNRIHLGEKNQLTSIWFVAIIMRK